MSRKILVLDFDGTLHRYSSGWSGIDHVLDGPVDGAMAFLRGAIEHFEVHVVSSRSREQSGRNAMRYSIASWLTEAFGDEPGSAVYRELHFPEHKPPAFLTLDDRALTFTGTFPPVEELLAFEPWTRRTPATAEG